MPETNGPNFEVSKRGIVIRWHYVIVVLATLIIGPKFLPDFYAQQSRAEIEKRMVSQENELKDIREKLASCEEVNNFIMHQFGLDKMTPPAEDHTRRH